MGLAGSINALPLSETIVLIDRTCCGIALLHNLLMFLFIVRINMVYKELSLDNPFRRKLFYSLIWCMIMSVLFNIIITLLTFNAIVNCHLLLLLGIIGYVSLKYSVWNFSVMRLKVTFYDSAYSYSHSFVNGLRYALVLNALIMILVSAVYGIYLGAGYVIFISKYNSCVVQTSWLIAGLIGTGEAAANISCYWLFWRKIKEIHDILLKYITRKYAILIATSMLSTYSFMGLIVFTDLAYTVAAFDSCVNIWCLVLFDARFDWLYVKIFKCIAKKPLPKTDNDTPRSRTIDITSDSDKNKIKNRITMSRIEQQLGQTVNDHTMVNT